MPGKVYLVGAGPWDPGLLTIRGRELVSRADVIVYDYLVNPEHLEAASSAAELLPTGRPPNRMTQAEISALLVERAKTGAEVVRLKGGDPFVFGRGGEEAEVLVAAGIPFEVIPGVTAAIASAAYAGIPVTHRGYGSTLAFCTGHFRDDGPDDDVDWGALSRMDTIAFYMAAKRLGRLRDRLCEAGRDLTTPVALVRWATRPDQRTLVSTLGAMVADAEEAKLEPPLTVIVGDIVSLRDQIGWYEHRPLFGQRIVVTRSRPQAGVFAHRLHELGAEVLACPTINFDGVFDDRVAAALGELGSYDWVLFTSANGVDFFMEALDQSGRDSRAFGGARIGCVGPATARRLSGYGLKADLVPETFVAEGLIESLTGLGVSGARVLIPRAEVARDVLPDTLKELGAEVRILPIYRTTAGDVPAATRARIEAGDFDVVTFTASSTVEHFCRLFRPEVLTAIQERVIAACIGPITAKTAQSMGFRVDVTAEEYTIAGLTSALSNWGTWSNDT